jgi:hypothetical protein
LSSLGFFGHFLPLISYEALAEAEAHMRGMHVWCQSKSPGFLSVSVRLG